MKKEVYIIVKKGTNKAEGVIWGGIGVSNETALVDRNNSSNTITIFETEEEAIQEIEKKKIFWNKHNGECSLYFYDEKTTPDDLEILKINI